MLKDYKINYLQINNQNILTIASPQGEKYGLAECIEEESYFSLSSEQVKDLVNEMRKVTPKKIPIKESKLVADLIEHVEKGGPGIPSNLILEETRNILGDRD